MGNTQGNMTQRELATCLDLHSRNVPQHQIAKVVGHRVGAVNKALKRFEGLFKTLAEVRDYRNIKAQLLDAAALTMLKSVVDDKTIDRASLYHRAIAYKILDNASRLEQGQATAHIKSMIFTQSGPPLPEPEGDLVHENNSSRELEEETEPVNPLHTE